MKGVSSAGALSDEALSAGGAGGVSSRGISSRGTGDGVVPGWDSSLITSNSRVSRRVDSGVDHSRRAVQSSNNHMQQTGVNCFACISTS